MSSSKYGLTKLIYLCFSLLVISLNGILGWVVKPRTFGTGWGELHLFIVCQGWVDVSIPRGDT